MGGTFLIAILRELGHLGGATFCDLVLWLWTSFGDLLAHCLGKSVEPDRDWAGVCAATNCDPFAAYIYIHIHIYIYLFVYLFIYLLIFTHTHIYVYTYVYIYIYVNIYICKYIYM